MMPRHVRIVPPSPRQHCVQASRASISPDIPFHPGVPLTSGLPAEQYARLKRKYEQRRKKEKEEATDALKRENEHRKDRGLCNDFCQPSSYSHHYQSHRDRDWNGIPRERCDRHATIQAYTAQLLSHSSQSTGTWYNDYEPSDLALSPKQHTDRRGSTVTRFTHPTIPEGVINDFKQKWHEDEEDYDADQYLADVITPQHARWRLHEPLTSSADYTVSVDPEVNKMVSHVSEYMARYGHNSPLLPPLYREDGLGRPIRTFAPAVSTPSFAEVDIPTHAIEPPSPDLDVGTYESSSGQRSPVPGVQSQFSWNSTGDRACLLHRAQLGRRFGKMMDHLNGSHLR